VQLRVGAAQEKARKIIIRELVQDDRRIVIEGVTPAVDDGRFAAKHQCGETLQIEADVYMDTQDQLAVDVLWKATNSRLWETVHMSPVGNDRWMGRITLEKVGLYEFVVEAWHDWFGTYYRGLSRKVEASVDVSLEIEEGKQMLKKSLAALKKEKLTKIHSDGQFKRHQATNFNASIIRNLTKIVEALKPGNVVKEPGDEFVPNDTLLSHLHTYSEDQQADLAILLSDFTLSVMHIAGPQEFLTHSQHYPIRSERRAAEFSSWYEMFPRSQSGDANRHGTFKDVIERLPNISAMGFDTLYFPPIHPIGEKNRKGKNNSLISAPTDPGSPYAIGSSEGGHEAIHPELGNWQDFRQLRDEAKALGIEIALDYAIQCSPDHPWLKEHPEWFDWRSDGSVKYAENPPKKYQDIVSLDFYAPQAIPHLWKALRDVVMLWAKEGVRTFRVDNPHTKPLPFWEWMIREVQAKYPDTIFLSEAFTTPKMMARLAKVGFTQSYTYFTWRNQKHEITEYLSQLLSGDTPEYFRPHFFVNTPDINPFYLQHTGRNGFLVRAVVAATTSGLWGISSGFEICEAEAIPEKEEFRNSEKYEIKVWDWNREGNIIPEITLLNRLRKTYPQLQTHLGLRFHPADNEQVLFYSKEGTHLPDQPLDSLVLVAINLSAHYLQDTNLELPLYLLGLDDHAAIEVHDLVSDTRFTWHGKWQRARLDPEQYLYVIWEIKAAGA
jgi:starch synthase (maltosyl-transferring)